MSKNNGTNTTTTMIAGTTTPPTQQLDFPSVLNFLQKEYRKMENERQLWELERSEYKRTINFLEGSRKSHEKIQYDLLRRVKMLEYVLRSERLKFSSLADEIKKTVTDNNQREHLMAHVEKLIISPPLPSTSSSATNSATVTSSNRSVSSGTSNTFESTEYPPKSSQILRKCLDELECSDVWSLLSKIPSLSEYEHLDQYKRVKPIMTESLNEKSNRKENNEQTDTVRMVPKAANVSSNMNSIGNEPVVSSQSVASSTGIVPTSNYDSTQIESTAKNSNDNTSSNENKANAEPEDELSEQFARKFPSLARHTSSGSLKKAKKKKEIENVDLTLEPNTSFGKYQDVLSQHTESIENLEQMKKRKSENGSKSSSSSRNSLSSTSKIWKPKYVLSGHLDAVRSLCFHNEAPVLITASEDCTLKMWNIEKLGKRSMDPGHTFRGHTGPVFAVACNGQFIFSGGEDGTVRIWNFPPFDHDPYTNHGYASPFELLSLSSHEDAIWSLSVAQNTLLSAGADGAVRVWSIPKISAQSYTPNGASSVPSANFLLNMIEMDHFIPTCVTHLPNDPSKFIVSSTLGELVLVDIETGKQIWKYQIDGGSGATDASKLIYKVVAHSVMPLLATGCEDSKIRFHDVNSGKLTISENNVLGHSDAVSTLSFSSCGQYLMSGGYDCSLRIWDIQSRNCVQEIPTHRRKYSEGIHDVVYHPTKSLVASCGADSLVKIYH